MTVKTLIQELMRYPEDLEVVTAEEGFGFITVTDLSIQKPEKWEEDKNLGEQVVWLS